MGIFAYILDSRPAFLGQTRQPLSLLLTPAGRSTMLGYLSDCATPVTGLPPTVLPLFDPTDAYEEALRATGVEVGAVIAAQHIDELITALEPSDWMLLIDPRFFPAGGFDLRPMLAETGNCRMAKHLAPLNLSDAGTRELVQFAAPGRVRRIQRYYDGVTQLRSIGVACSLVSAASAQELGQHTLACLADLRNALSQHGVPSRDFSHVGGMIDLNEEAGLRELSERFTLDDTAMPGAPPYTSAGQRVLVGPRCRIDPAARLVGPVVLHSDVKVEAGATIVGPTVIGARSRISANAIVAQCLVMPGTFIAPDESHRQRVLHDDLEADSSLAGWTTGDAASSDNYLRIVHSWRTFGLDDRRDARTRSEYIAIKRCLDAVAALVGLILLAPLLLITAGLVKLTSRGPIYFAHEREGLGGAVFRCYKFRTMRVGAQHEQRRLYSQNKVDGPQFKMDVDPRVTPLGAWLRKTNIDELPQLFNVLIGEMSIIGPRPSPFRENQICVPWRNARLSVRPGITGLWQICRHERSVGDFHQWIFYDTLYVRHLSFWLDVKILIATVLTFGGRLSVPLHWIIPGDRLSRDDDVLGAARGAPQIYHPHASEAISSGPVARVMP